MINLIIFHDEGIYTSSIMQITQIDEVLSEQMSGPNDEIENHFNQNITGTIKNGKYKGKLVFVENTYAYSQISSTKYVIGQKLFVEVKEENNNLRIRIQGVKRDGYISLFTTALLFVLILVAKIHGFRAFLTLFVNSFLVISTIILYRHGIHVVLLCIILILFIGISSLVLTNGIHKQTFLAIFISLVSVVFLFVLYKIVFFYSGDPEYLIQDYTEGVEELSEYFLIGAIGIVLTIPIAWIVLLLSYGRKEDET